MEFEIDNLDRLEDFADEFVKYLERGDLINLIGDLGAGKTTFVQKIGRALNVKDQVTSPSFGIVSYHIADVDFYHIDFYRFEDEREIEGLDYEDFLYPRGYSFIEWGERVGSYLPQDRIDMEIEIAEGDKRIFRLLDSKRAERLEEGLRCSF